MYLLKVRALETVHYYRYYYFNPYRHKAGSPSLLGFEQPLGSEGSDDTDAPLHSDDGRHGVGGVEEPHEDP